MKTIIYLTDNSLDGRIAALCRRKLLEVAEGRPIVSVSQRPVDLGRNVCLGEIGRSWLSLYRQLAAGCEAVGTDWVAVAEHDCLYTPEHLAYQPDDGGVFWYNDNRWLVQQGGNHPELNGMYSWWPGSLALSQLICRRDLLAACVGERLALLEAGGSPRLLGRAEPGVLSARDLARARRHARSGRAVWLRGYFENLTHYEHRTFKTRLPNLDIRHGSNFTGPKRGNRRRYELAYWGRWETVWSEES
jgi:hypothetical protein